MISYGCREPTTDPRIIFLEQMHVPFNHKCMYSFRYSLCHFGQCSNGFHLTETINKIKSNASGKYRARYLHGDNYHVLNTYTVAMLTINSKLR